MVTTLFYANLLVLGRCWRTRYSWTSRTKRRPCNESQYCCLYITYINFLSRVKMVNQALMDLQVSQELKDHKVHLEFRVILELEDHE